MRGFGLRKIYNAYGADILIANEEIRVVFCHSDIRAAGRFSAVVPISQSGISTSGNKPRDIKKHYAVAVRKDQHRAIVSEYHAVGVSADMDDPGERDSTCFSCEYGNFRGRVRVACLAVPRRQRDENPAAVLTRKRLKRVRTR